MNIEEILASMQGIIDGAAGRSLTDEECTNYEKLEAQLQDTKRHNEIVARHNTWTSPIAPAVHVAPPKVDNGLDLAFSNYLRTGIPNMDIAGLRVVNAQGEGVSTAGGYTVPPGFLDRIIEKRKAFGGLASVVEERTTADGTPMHMATNDDTGNQGAITAESAAVASGADLVFGDVTWGAYTYTAAGGGSNSPLRVSIEWLQDSQFPMEDYIARALAKRIHRKQAVDWVTGTGVGQPMGLVASSLTADRDLDTADTPDYEDLVEFTDLLDADYEQNAMWVMKKNTWSQLRLILDLNGRPILQEANDSITGLPVRRLFGAPVVIDEAMPTLSAAADGYCIAYGDFQEAYMIRRVAPMTIFVNPYSRADHREIEYLAWERADGNIKQRAAYVILQNNT